MRLSWAVAHFFVAFHLKNVIVKVLIKCTNFFPKTLAFNK